MADWDFWEPAATHWSNLCTPTARLARRACGADGVAKRAVTLLCGAAGAVKKCRKLMLKNVPKDKVWASVLLF